AQRADRAVEDRGRSVRPRPQLMAAMLPQVGRDLLAELVQLLEPGVRAVASGAARVREVGAEHRREHGVRFGNRTRAGEKLLDLVDDPVGLADPDRMIDAGDLHVLRAGDIAREIAPRLRPHTRILVAVDDERRNANRREDAADVDLAVHPRQRDRTSRASPEPLEAGPPRAEAFVADEVRTEALQRAAVAPARLGHRDEGLDLLLGEHAG